MSGFGHRVYKNYDPRAKVIKKLAEEVFSIVGRDPLIEVLFFYFFIFPNTKFSIFMDGRMCLFVQVPSVLLSPSTVLVIKTISKL